MPINGFHFSVKKRKNLCFYKIPKIYLEIFRIQKLSIFKIVIFVFFFVEERIIFSILRVYFYEFRSLVVYEDVSLFRLVSTLKHPTNQTVESSFALPCSHCTALLDL